MIDRPPAADGTVGLDGEWRFSPIATVGTDSEAASLEDRFEQARQEPMRPDFDDRDWPIIRVPGAWGRQGYPRVDAAWYRVRVRLDPAVTGSRRDERSLGLAVRKVSTGYDVWADGRFLGSVGGPPPAMAYDRYAIFPLPSDVFVGDREIVLAFRVYRHPVVGRFSGGLRESIHVGPLGLLHRQAVLADLPYATFAAVFFVFGLYHLVLYRRRPGSRTYLQLGLLLVAVSAYTFLETQLRFAVIPDFVIAKEIEHFLTIAIPGLALLTIWRLLDRLPPRWLRVYAGLFPAAGALAVVEPGIELNLRLIAGLPVAVAPGIVAVAVLIARRWRQGNPEARFVGFGGAVLVAAFAWDVLAANNLVPLVYVAVYAFACFLFTLVFSLANRFARVHRHLDTLRGQLEARVETRTSQLHAAKSAAEEANRAKGDFLANISHELRTPVHGILGGISRLRRHAPAGDTWADTAEREAGRLLHLIDDLLDFSSIEAGELTFESETFDPRRALDGLLATTRQRARARGLRFDSQWRDDVPARLDGSPTRLRQVLAHLLDNAIKFTDRGSIAFRVGAAEFARPTSARLDDFLRFEVVDTGVGIPPEVQDRLFRPFSQVDGSSTRRHGGTGLGLVLAQRIVDAVGGELGVDRTHEGGSCFWVHWPRSYDPGKRASASPPTSDDGDGPPGAGPPTERDFA